MGTFLWNRVTKCDSGHTLNPLMHLFLFLAGIIAISFLGFGETESVQSMKLYEFSQEIFGWKTVGITAAIAMLSHTVGFLVRGRVGLVVLPVAMTAGYYTWFYASVVYIQNSLYFQCLILCVPNLLFWIWYTLQFRRRARGEVEAFVH